VYRDNVYASVEWRDEVKTRIYRKIRRFGVNLVNLENLDDHHFLGTTSSEGASDACTESPSACCMTSC
jgi:hypothetical protein